MAMRSEGANPAEPFARGVHFPESDAEIIGGGLIAQ